MKLKKIASLALAGVMAVSMLAGCSTTSVAPTPDPDDDNGVVTTAGYSKTFEDTLSEYADRRISMSDSAELTANLNTAIGNVSSSLMTEFHKVNMDVVDLALNQPMNDRAVAWMIDDLGGSDVVMSQSAAFKALVPQPDELIDDANLDKTVIMLFAVDNAVDENAAVKQIAKKLDEDIRRLYNDNDSTQERGFCKVDHTTLNYTYTGSVSVASKNWVDVTTVGMHFVAVQINRVAA